MTGLVGRRLAAALPTLLGVLLVVFWVIHLIPGDPARVILGTTATAEQLAETRSALGLDRPLPEQFASFMGRYLKGDLGRSIISRRPVVEEIALRFPPTAQLAVGGMAVACLLGIPLGIISASRRGSLIDLLALVVSSLGIAAPVFWIGLLLSLVFATKLDWFPSIGAGRAGDWVSVLRALVLPSLTLGLSGMALIARMTRSCMLDVLQEDYIRTARAKGLSEKVVIYRHALRNAAIPVVTIVGLNVGYLIGGTVLVETVFARPGLGYLMVQAILARDYPLVQGLTFFVAGSFILVNLITDLAYAWLDPRIRYR